MEIIKLVVISSLDIFITSLIIYFIIKLLLKTEKLMLILNAFILFFIIYFFAEVLELKTVTFLLSNIASWFVIIVIIIFQKEIRDSLERVGTFSGFFSKDGSDKLDFSDELYEVVKRLSLRKVGALITLEGETKLEEYVSRAVALNADFSKELVETIFNKESALHDGAIIINNNKIVSASTYYPIALDLNLDKSLGTRHRAAVTISKETDSTTIVISEETGKISITYRGKIYQNISEEFFKEFIKEKYNKE